MHGIPCVDLFLLLKEMQNKTVFRFSFEIIMNRLDWVSLNIFSHSYGQSLCLRVSDGKIILVFCRIPAKLHFQIKEFLILYSFIIFVRLIVFMK